MKNKINNRLILIFFLIALFLVFFFGNTVSAETIYFGEFINYYTPEAATLESIPYTVSAATPSGVSKDIEIWSYTLTEYSDSDFTEVVGDPMTVYNDEDGNILVSLEYTEAGTYYYTIVQDDITTDGYYEDEDVKTIIIVVTLNDDDELVATVSADSDLNFDVLVDPDPGTITLVAGKTLVDTTDEGYTLQADQFEFQLVYDGEVLATATNDEDGRIVFDYEYTEAGDFTMYIVEVDAGDEHITYADSISFLLHVEEDETGTLVATVTILTDDEDDETETSE